MLKEKSPFSFPLASLIFSVELHVCFFLQLQCPANDSEHVGGNQATCPAPRQQVRIKCDMSGNHLRFGCNHGDWDMFKVYLAVVQRRHLESAVERGARGAE